MANEIFVDTSGFYALLVRRDDQHDAAREVVSRSRSRKRAFVTTDYVLDETATLLKARSLSHLLRPLFERVLDSRACRVEWIGSDRFRRTMDFFLKHQDQNWSFTDCVSFCVMKELKIRRALSKDRDFRHAGFDPLLTDGS